MYTPIAIFYISLLGLITMVWLKRYEVQTGRQTVASRLGHSIDQGLASIFDLIRRSISYFNKKTLIAIIQIMAYHVLLRIRRVYVELKHRALLNPHGKKLIDAVRGRGTVRDHGASFYLRRISDK